MNLCKAVLPEGQRCDNPTDPRCGCNATN